jgi:hypothetical protein
VLSLLSCASTQVSKPTYFETVKANHKTIAILPAFVKLLVPADAKSKISREAIEDAQTKLSFIIQNEMYKWFQKNKYTVAVQDVRYSNNLLFSKGLSFAEYKTIPKDSIAKILGVDVVIFATTDLTKISYKSIDVYLNFTSPLTAIASAGFTALNLAKPTTTVSDDIDMYFRVVDASSNSKLLEKSYSSKVTADKGLEEFYRNSIKNFAKNFPYKK